MTKNRLTRGWEPAVLYRIDTKPITIGPGADPPKKKQKASAVADAFVLPS